MILSELVDVYQTRFFQESIPIPGFNVVAQPFGDHQEVKHLQYNSPMPLYSPQTAAEQYLQQTGGLFGTEYVLI